MPVFMLPDGCELVGIVEADDGRASEICEKFACQRFDSAEALAVSCDAVSVVVRLISTAKSLCHCCLAAVIC